jgi:hypothetical protein
MPIRQRITGDQGEAKVLKPWYSSEEAKRALGFICQSVNEQGETVGIMGVPEEPQLKLMDVDLHDDEFDEIIALDEARAQWANITLAVALFGTRVRIDGRKQPRAALIANANAPHPALRYRRPQPPGIKALADRVEEVLNEIRRLNNSGGSSAPFELYALADRLERSSDLIDRRFRQLWRTADGAATLA